MDKLTKFDKQCLEKIPPQEMKRICNEVEVRIVKIFGGSVMSPYCAYTYCTKCRQGQTLSKMIKTRCVCEIQTGEALCAHHFTEKLQRELCQKYLDEHKPKLDLQDFARV